MKRSMLPILLIILLVVLGTYFFTPLGPKARGYAGRLWSKNAVALKTDRQVSENAYGWQLTDSEGDPYNFTQEKGKVVFLNFWATWCAPCLKEMPDIQKLYDAYGDKVSFLLVTHEDIAKIQTFLQKKKYTLPMYFTNKANIPDELASKSIPTTYIIGKSGTIAKAETGSVDWSSDEIRSLLDGLLAQ